MGFDDRVNAFRDADRDRRSAAESGETSLRAIAVRQLAEAGAEALRYLSARGAPPLVLGTLNHRTVIRNYAFKAVGRAWLLDQDFHVALTDGGELVIAKTPLGDNRGKRLERGASLAQLPSYFAAADSMFTSLSTGRSWDESSLRIEVDRTRGVTIGGRSALDWVAGRVAAMS